MFKLRNEYISWKDILNVTLLFIVSRFIIAFFVGYLSVGPLGFDRTHYQKKWVNDKFTIKLQENNSCIIFSGRSPETQHISVKLNGKPIKAFLLSQDPKEYAIDLEGFGTTKGSTLEFNGDYSFKPIGDTRQLSWEMLSFKVDGEEVLGTISSIEPSGIYHLESETFARYNLKDAILKNIVRWDMGWYKKIVEGGYSYNFNNSTEQSVAFYYGHPLIARAVHKLLNIDAGNSLILVSNFSTFIGFILMFYISRRIGLSSKVGLMGIALFAFNPFSIFLVSGYSEGLYILVSAVTIILLLNKKYLPAAVVGGFLSGIRSIGVFFALIFFIDYFFIEKEKLNLRNLLKSVPLLILTVWGKLAFMCYNYLHFHNAFASEDVQKAWGNIGGALTIVDKLKNLYHYITIPFSNRFDIRDVSVISILLVYLLILIFLIRSFYIFKNRFCLSLSSDGSHEDTIEMKSELLILVWSIVQIILPLIVFGMKGNNPFSMGRYVLPMFPLYILLGRMLKDRIALFITFLALFTLQMLIVTEGFTFGHLAGVFVF